MKKWIINFFGNFKKQKDGFFPKWVIDIDQYLLLNSPLIWSSRIHFILFYAIIICGINLLFVYVIPLKLGESFFSLAHVMLINFISTFILFFYWQYRQAFFNFRVMNGNTSRFHDIKVAVLFLLITFILFIAMLAPSLYYGERIADNFFDDELSEYHNFVNPFNDNPRTKLSFEEFNEKFQAYNNETSKIIGFGLKSWLNNERDRYYYYEMTDSAVFNLNGNHDIGVFEYIKKATKDRQTSGQSEFKYKWEFDLKSVSMDSVELDDRKIVRIDIPAVLIETNDLKPNNEKFINTEFNLTIYKLGEDQYFDVKDVQWAIIEDRILSSNIGFSANSNFKQNLFYFTKDYHQQFESHYIFFLIILFFAYYLFFSGFILKYFQIRIYIVNFILPIIFSIIFSLIIIDISELRDSYIYSSLLFVILTVLMFVVKNMWKTRILLWIMAMLPIICFLFLIQNKTVE